MECISTNNFDTIILYQIQYPILNIVSAVDQTIFEHKKTFSHCFFEFQFALDIDYQIILCTNIMGK